MSRHWLKAGVAAVAATALFAAGCGDDDDTTTDESEDTADIEEGTPAAEGGDVEAYCEAELTLETAPPPDVDFETAPPEEIAEALKSYASDVMGPAADDAVAAAPEEVAGDIAVLAAALDELEQSGDFAVFEDPATTAASDAVHRFDVDNCGWTSYEITATEYSFDGLPADLESGATSFEFANDGDEVHELLLVRKNDGVTETADEILVLPDEEAMSMITVRGEPAVASPGGSDYLVADLQPGDYIALCFVPTGTTGMDGPPPEGPPHIVHGMVAEFVVS